MTGETRILFVLLSALALMGVASSRGAESDNQLPQELRSLAAELGCGPVPGFYDRPGMVDPPYLYGYLPGEKEESAVFWCYREHEEKPYRLVFVESLGQGREGHVASTAAWRNYPGGLALYEEQKVPLSKFRFLDKPQEYGPEGKTTQYAPVQEYYDGTTTLFYQEGGRWLFLMLD